MFEEPIETALVALCFGQWIALLSLWDAAGRGVEAMGFVGQRNLARVLVAAAPLIGLFGTVTGMIHTFDAMQRGGSASDDGVAAGIGLALESTQLGLFVAIPGLVVLALCGQRRRRALDTTRAGVPAGSPS